MHTFRPLENFYALLKSEELEPLIAMFAGEPILDTPLQGRIDGAQAFSSFASGQKRWLDDHDSRSSHLNTIATPERLVVETILYLTISGEEIDLPVALAADLSGGKPESIRIYHSTWPLTGSHRVRPPLLPVPKVSPVEPKVIQRYMQGLENGDSAAVLALFAKDGCVRQPSGARFQVCGERLRDFYEPALNHGGIRLTHCTATFDGSSCAIEFICDEWAHTALPQQAGLAVYDVESGRLSAVRIYDDVEPPL